MTYIKLKDFCDQNSISYITGYRWFKANQIPGAYQTGSGTILIPDDKNEIKTEQNNDAMSLFLKKTVEYSKNNSTVEDFAAYVISNFQLKINNTPENPKYSKQKPKSEEVQKHFQQFITKSDKPKPNSFIMEPETLEDLSITTATINREELAKDFAQAVEVPPSTTYYNNSEHFVSAMADKINGSMSLEGNVNQSVDLISTPQSINYTGSNNLTFTGSLFSTSNVCDFSEPGIQTFFVNQSFQPEIEISEETKTTPPRSKRGRKPNKK